MSAMFRVVTTHLAKLEVKSGVLAAEEEFMLAMVSEYHNQLLAQTDDTLGQGLNRLLEAQPEHHQHHQQQQHSISEKEITN
jgi:hypothetical protein